MPIIIYCGTIYDNLLQMGYSRILRDKKCHLIFSKILCVLQKSLKKVYRGKEIGFRGIGVRV